MQYIYLVMDSQELTSIGSMERYLKNPTGFAQKYPRMINSSRGLADWVDIMELQYFGKCNPDDALLDRVTKLEMRVYSAPNKNALFMRRIHDLITTLGPEQYPADIAEAKTAPSKPAKQVVLASVFQVPINPAVAGMANRMQIPLLNCCQPKRCSASGICASFPSFAHTCVCSQSD